MVKGLYVHFRSIMNGIIAIILRPPVVESADISIERIINKGSSVCRFGDGELSLILGRGIGFQEQNKHLAVRLKEILKINDNKLMVCIPNVFSKLDEYTDEFNQYWSSVLRNERLTWYRLINRKKTYYDALLSRPYTGVKDKSISLERFEKIKTIWNGRNLLIIEGQFTRMGVGNNLFENANSIQRIIAPSKNAFDWYDSIIKSVKNQDQSKLILISLGPTATVLAYDLHLLGFQAIDIGHLDVQYEYFNQKAERRIKLQNKYVNEVEGGDLVEDVEDEVYKNSILKIIGLK